MKTNWKRAILFAVIFGVIAGFIDFVLATFLHVDNTIIFVIIVVAFVVIGSQLGIWIKKK